jgi:hypothetical protein
VAHAAAKYGAFNGSETPIIGWSGEVVAHAGGEQGRLRVQSRAQGVEAQRGGEDVSDADGNEYESGAFENERTAPAFLSSDSDSKRCKAEIQYIAGVGQATSEFGGDGKIQSVADSNGDELEESGDMRSFQGFKEGDWWSVEPELGRVADGVAHRVDRLRAIGNGQVPAVARVAWNYLRGKS